MTAPLDPKNFQMSAEYARDYWHCVVPNDTLLTDILKPAFWVHVAHRIKPMALIDVCTYDGLLDVQLRVISVQMGMPVLRPRLVFENEAARVPILARHATEAATPAEQLVAEGRASVPDGYKVGWNVGRKAFYVQRKADGFMIAQNIPTFDEGLKLAIAHSEASNSPMAQAG